jgi:rhamnulokinase
MLGALQRDGLMVSEAGNVQDLTIGQDEASQWDVSGIYQQVLGAARGIAAQEEPVRGISFHTSVSDCLLFEGNGSLVAPATRTVEAAAAAQLEKVLSKIPLEQFFEETGIQPTAQSMLCQLAAESSRRLRRSAHALSLADAFNFLLSGVPRAEVSQASQTHLYNPLTKTWSERFLKVAGLPPKLLAPVVQAGTKLGDVRADISREAGLEDARVIATCSHQTAAALAALTIADGGDWAYLCPDDWTLLGTKLEGPFINDISREMKYSNLMGYGESVGFHKRWVGLWLVEECQRAWMQQDRALDSEVLMHLATSATPFEALIDPADSRFLSAGDMPQEIQAFCRETGQDAPRKPGPILRCVLESLALQYRKGLLELGYITGRNLSRLYVLGGKSNLLFNHFLANALQIPVVIVPSETASVGNVVLQALALGHIPSLEQARELVRRCLKTQTINPHSAAWTEAYDRFLSLGPSAEEPQDGDGSSL